MRIAIDASGRLVIPKPLRDQLGLTHPAELQAEIVDGRLELTVPDVDARVEVLEDGLASIVTDEPTPELTTDEVRQTLEQIRR